MNILYMILIIIIIAIISSLLFRIKCNFISHSKNNQNILTTDVILSAADIHSSLSLAPLYFVFVIFSIIALCCEFSDAESTNIGILLFNSIIGITFSIATYFSIKNNLRKRSSILNHQYFITVDRLMDKERKHNNGSSYTYHFFFENYFGKYNQQCDTDFHNYNKARIGDKYYLVILPNGEAYSFSCYEYILEDNSVVINGTELHNYVNVTPIPTSRISSDKTFTMPVDNNTSTEDTCSNTGNNSRYNTTPKKEIHINKEDIYNDVCGFGIGIVLIMVFCFFVLAIAIFFSVVDGVKIKMLLFLIVCSFVSIAFFYKNISNAIKIDKDIKNNTFKINKESIYAIDENLDFKYKNIYRTLRFTGDPAIHQVNFSDFSDIEVGDQVYTIKIEGSNKTVIYPPNTIFDDMDDSVFS